MCSYDAKSLQSLIYDNDDKKVAPKTSMADEFGFKYLLWAYGPGHWADSSNLSDLLLCTGCTTCNVYHE